MIGAQLYARDVFDACENASLRQPLFWTFDDRLDRLRLLNPRSYVYHVLDLYPHTPREEEVINGAAAVFTVSSRLMKHYEQLSPRCRLLPNGVETKWFNPAACTGQPRPRELQSDGYRKVIGYTGTTGRHADLETVLAVARTFSDCLIVLVGPILKGPHGAQGSAKMALHRLARLPNVRFVKPKPVRDLPAFVHAFDVCIMPGMRDQWAAHSDPLKVYQYLAMGKPVVSSKFAHSDVPAALYYPADSTAAFIERIHEAIAEVRTHTLEQARFNAVASHDWSRLTTDALAFLHGIGCDIFPHANSHHIPASAIGRKLTGDL